eukprot:110843-Chlamydomonas_euryale.AAC.1
MSRGRAARPSQYKLRILFRVACPSGLGRILPHPVPSRPVPSRPIPSSERGCCAGRQMTSPVPSCASNASSASTASSARHVGTRKAKAPLAELQVATT